MFHLFSSNPWIPNVFTLLQITPPSFTFPLKSLGRLTVCRRKDWNRRRLASSTVYMLMNTDPQSSPLRSLHKCPHVVIVNHGFKVCCRTSYEPRDAVALASGARPRVINLVFTLAAPTSFKNMVSGPALEHLMNWCGTWPHRIVWIPPAGCSQGWEPLG